MGTQMSVYVDDMFAPYRRMLMCHMVADTVDELHEMADKIGIARKWFQGDHYDICKAKRELAIRFGAKAVSRMELGRIVVAQRRAVREKLSQTQGEDTMGKTRLEGAGLDDLFAEQLVRDHGAAVARERTSGPAREAVDRVIARAEIEAKDHAFEVSTLHG